MLAGLLVPLLLPAWLLLRGRRDLALATVVAVLATLLVVSVLKGFTSPASPEAAVPRDLVERSQTFRLGLLRAGMFESAWEGWPSGHAATNTALAVTVARLAWGSGLARGPLAWAIWVCLATAFGIRGEVHRLSDTLVGAAVGQSSPGGWADTSASRHPFRAPRNRSRPTAPPWRFR